MYHVEDILNISQHLLLNLELSIGFTVLKHVELDDPGYNLKIIPIWPKLSIIYIF